MILILLMAGSGARFGSELPKQYHLLSGKKVYLRTLDAFLAAYPWQEIILVADKSFHDIIKKDLSEYQQYPVRIVTGGTTRQESVFLALQNLPSTTHSVMVHDAVRPFVSQDIITANIAALQDSSGVDTCLPAADTIIQTLDGTKIHAMGPRAQFWRGQTPQTFHFETLLSAHQKAREAQIIDATDDCFLVHRLALPIHIVRGDEKNIKITTELDLFLAEQMLRLIEKAPGHGSCNLAGKTIVVTGGLGGIGSAICALLQKYGAHPIPLSRTSVEFQADLTNPEETARAFAAIDAKYGPLDALINSHGLLHIAPLASLEVAMAKNLLDVNFLSVVYTCKYARIKPAGHIINISSSSYFRGRKNFSLYSAAKSALVNFTQALAEERPDLHIACLVPHRTNTTMRREYFPYESPQELLAPQEIAQKALELVCTRPLRGHVLEVRKRF